ncbi:class I SAM-dependent DNA methyltransferase [Labrys monachus]|uniref:TPR repeat methyltransferase n=1 Tax=Labrys monachus TaxID=217067 RepID=A0ABU0FEX9_9HYPH|nr:methyltransferase domain-containing protein [Labrys monachus]MDQ0392580.1 putative TPR repeat methyltransferase [Labrys monachus]
MSYPRSSGDIIADRRFAYAMSYKAEGDLQAAAELVEQALASVPGWATGWFALGDLLESAGRREAAIAAYRRCLDIDAVDEAGAGARLARLGAIEADGAMAPAHVAALFDDYADRFEASLVNGLGYRGPALLLAALEPLRKPFRFGHALDLGCGTGLAGEAFRASCASIEGVDLSAAMLSLARRKGLYDRLEQGDVATFLEGRPAQSADLLLAADVFVYLGNLEAIFRQAARVLAPGGLFAFSAQRWDGPEAFILNHDMRYAHSHAAIAAWAGAAGLAIACRNDEWARRDRGQPVPGMVAVLERS